MTARKPRSNTPRNRVPPAVQADFLSPKEAHSKTQLGVRIAETTHRQLKLAAVMRGMTVQTLVEQAVFEFLKNHPELLQNGLAALPQTAKSAARTAR
jgi:predicted HicB family RNase H-like nuclease